MLSREYIHLKKDIFIIASLCIFAYVGLNGYIGWSDTGYLDLVDMAKSFLNCVLALGAVFVVTVVMGSIYSVLTGDKHATSTSAKQARASSRNAANARAILPVAEEKNFSLQIRGIGTVIGKLTNDEIWNNIAEKRESFLSKNPNDYQWDANGRSSDFSQSEGLAFKFAARSAVERWPIPVVIWGPAADADNKYIAASDIASARQAASLGLSMFIGQDGEYTSDGPAMLRKLFDVFDRHPDLPAVVILTADGTLQRQILTKSAGNVNQNGYFVPAMPDSVSAMLVTRSERVDRLLRPFAVSETADTDMRDTQYDSIKLWNFFWKKSDGSSKDDYDAFYKNWAEANGFDTSSPGTMSVDWWQKQLPTLWSQIRNTGPGHFTPTPYLPVRWTTWQIKQFDNAPLLGYLHRPVEVKLTDDDGRPLNTVDQIHALKTGWETATASLAPDTAPARVFFDTSGDAKWLIPLSQAINQATASKLDITELRQGYDIGSRIGNTGVTSQMVQISLGTISSFLDGGTSATISRRPNGSADIVVVTPTDAHTKAKVQETFRVNPFGW